MRQVLFVCLGNICRSPAAEGVFQNFIDKQELGSELSCDSAGTSSFHEGELADPRMRHHAKERGYEITSKARQFFLEDLEKFDLILAMDQSNFEDIKRHDPQGKYDHKIFKMTSFCQDHEVSEVPDPYLGGEDGFRLVLDILEDSCQNLFQKVTQGKV